ncbi:MAG: gamma-glutamyl-gamma-aminobutyrate hydrolase family protein [Erysipelotrichaceae bacterium]|nr:gamma-glutamyl-gamma-aminobutyrate hydrolase family protein [Erysipelotrichaceae bacterium]
MKPVIALSARDTIIRNTQGYYLQESYMNAVAAAGGTYLGVVPTKDHNYDHIADLCDGLIVCGGGDIDAKYFHEPLHEKAELVKENIDEMDFKLIEAFLSRKKPVLGICRGHQVLNVYYGGSLIQDIPSTIKSELRHSQAEARNVGTHKVHLTKDSFLGKKDEVFMTNSFHHQAVKDLGKTLEVIAISPDGIIEAIQNDEVMGVQWHPECMIEDEFHLNIIKTFIKRCQK